MTTERAVANVQQSGVEAASQHRQIINAGAMGELERIERTVVIPQIYQYSMKRWQQPDKVSLTSEAYAYINRELGVTFVKATEVPDNDGKMVNNPIHRVGYIYLRTIGVWRNRNGMLVAHTEDVEVDYNLVYQDARINARSAVVVTDENGTPMTYDGRPVWEGGIPMVKLSSEDELKAMKALSQLRTYGLRYAQTIAATRILKRATGIASLPIPSPQPFPIEVVTFRDTLTPDERVKQAGVDLGAMYGPAEVLGKEDFLNSEELAEVREFEPEDITEDIEAESVAAHIERQDDENDRTFDAPISRVHPSAEGDEGMFEPTPKRPRR